MPLNAIFLGNVVRKNARCVLASRFASPFILIFSPAFYLKELVKAKSTKNVWKNHFEVKHIPYGVFSQNAIRIKEGSIKPNNTNTLFPRWHIVRTHLLHTRTPNNTRGIQILICGMQITCMGCAVLQYTFPRLQNPHFSKSQRLFSRPLSFFMYPDQQLIQYNIMKSTQGLI